MKPRKMDKSEKESIVNYLIFIFDGVSLEDFDEIARTTKIKLALQAGEKAPKETVAA